MAERTLVCIGQVPGKRHPDFGRLAERLGDLPEGTTSVIALLAELQNYPWVDTKVNQMLRTAEARMPDLKCTLLKEKEAGSADVVCAHIEEIGLEKLRTVTVALLERVLGQTRVLCIAAEGRPSFFDALRRAGFPEDSLERFFVERTVSTGRNSNLISTLVEESKRCQHLLYAWDPLRSLDAKTKRRFSGKAYEAPTPSKVIAMFTRWLNARK